MSSDARAHRGARRHRRARREGLLPRRRASCSSRCCGSRWASSDFGGLAQALVVANTVNNVVVASGTQGVSRVVAGAPGHEDEALRAALRVHVPLALVVAVAMVRGRAALRALRAGRRRGAAAAGAGGGRAALRPLRAAHRLPQRDPPLRAPGRARRHLRHAAHHRPRGRRATAFAKHGPLGRARHDRGLGRRRGVHRPARRARSTGLGKALRARERDPPVCPRRARTSRILLPIAGRAALHEPALADRHRAPRALPQPERRGPGSRARPSATRSSRGSPSTRSARPSPSSRTSSSSA